MAIVSSNPGCSGCALGIVTLEDVIENLIGEVHQVHWSRGRGHYPLTSNLFYCSSPTGNCR